MNKNTFGEIMIYFKIIKGNGERVCDVDKQKRTWYFAVVGNIVKSHIDSDGIERFGSKAFRSGAKVFIEGKYWSFNDESIGVIGHNRFGRLVYESVPKELIENLRCQRLYSTSVIDMIDHYEAIDGPSWWHATVSDRKETEEFVKKWNET